MERGALHRCDGGGAVAERAQRKRERTACLRANNRSRASPGVSSKVAVFASTTC